MSTTKFAHGGNRLRGKIRAHRDAREFERALRNASPAMRQELIAAASRDFAR